jgi:hypothetical protein
MNSVQSNLGYPGTATATTITCNFLTRANEGVGAHAVNAAPGPGALVISFPNGRNDMTTVAVIAAIVCQHVLNTASLVSWWSPVNETQEQAIIAALDAWRPVTYLGSITMYVAFDGQFGPVLVS